MDWQELINKRHTTFAWEDTVPERETIQAVLEELYMHVPSKNLQFPWSIYVYRNNDFEIQKEIMTICHRNRERDINIDKGNPQVLAPWIIAFTNRWVKDLERRYEKTSDRPDYAQRDSEQIEIGIVALFLALAFANRGIQSGFCQNILNNQTRAKEIFKVAPDHEVRFIMGVGYGKSSDTLHTYIDPRTGNDKFIPFIPDNVERPYPRPAFESIFNFVGEN